MILKTFKLYEDYITFLLHRYDQILLYKDDENCSDDYEIYVWCSYVFANVCMYNEYGKEDMHCSWTFEGNLDGIKLFLWVNIEIWSCG